MPLTVIQPWVIHPAEPSWQAFLSFPASQTLHRENSEQTSWTQVVVMVRDCGTETARLGGQKLLVWWEHKQEATVLRQSNRTQPQQWGSSLLKSKGLFLLSQSHIVALNQEQAFFSALIGAEEAQDAGRTQTTAQVHSRTLAQAAPASPCCLPPLFLPHTFGLQWEQQRMPHGRKIIPQIPGFMKANRAPSLSS